MFKTGWLAVVFLAISAVAVRPAFASEEEIIKAVIHAEATNFLSGNYEEWAKYWVHGTDIRKIYAERGFCFELVGWEALKTFMQDRAAGPASPTRLNKIEKDNFEIRAYGKVAFVRLEDRLIYGESDPATAPVCHTTLFLEKHNGDWKLVNMSTVNTSTFSDMSPAANERDLNFVGYRLLASDRVKDAIEVFELAVKLFPNSSNAYDSLGEALMKNSDKQGARENYAKSLQLDPNNHNAALMLEKLNQE